MDDVTIEEIDPDHPDALWCLESYFRELTERFAEGFERERSLYPDLDSLRPPTGIFLVARLGDRPVACGGVTLASEDVAYIKRMWVDRSARGLGLGRRMLAALETAAVGLGCRMVQLETNRSLREAQQLYRSAGYEEVAPFNDEHYAHHWFRKRLDRTEGQSSA